MKNNKIELIDIADDLLILNKQTIDTLMRLDNCADCIALYIFYYKTAKWQRTNQIKANDTYVKKSLNWGRDKISKTKSILKEHGLIDIVQERKEGKISGWYIKVSYIVQKRKIEDCHILVDSKNTQNQQVADSTSGEEEINALKEKIKCLNKELEMLKNKGNFKSDSIQRMIKELPEELQPVLQEFRQHRKEIQAPLTETSCKRMLEKLQKISNGDTKKAVQIIERSIENGWRGIFPIDTRENKRPLKGQNEVLDMIERGLFDE